jgi:hypothetical protein
MSEFKHTKQELKQIMEIEFPKHLFKKADKTQLKLYKEIWRNAYIKGYMLAYEVDKIDME